MEMRYQQDLQVALRDRLRRLMIATHSDAGHEVSLTVHWINKQPALLAILAEAEAVEPDLSLEDFLSALKRHGMFSWPSSTEDGRATLVWKCMQRITSEIASGAESGRVGVNYAMPFARERNLNDCWREFSQRILQPLFDYLSERVGQESSVLYVLERYVRKVEWFDRQDLYDKAMANPKKAEDVYDADLRRFLFGEGINMPFSQAKSASGLSDVVSELDTDDPLVCEVKIFDGKDRGKRHLGSGVNQAFQYATDYNKQAAYLVIINLSGRQVDLPNENDSKAWPPYITVAGVRVYLITVRALPTPSASKLGKPKPITITRDDLIDPDAAEDGAE
jgi:hypothetical protein